MRRPFIAAAAASALMAVAPAPAAAQSDPRLEAAIALAQEGRRDSAQAAVAAILRTTTPADQLYPEVLYTSALLMTDADSMRRTLQKVVVEHSLSAWADNALLQLAELDFAGGNLPAAMRDLERLRTDFPQSDVFPEAAFWAARTYFDARQENPGCEWVGMGLARVSDSAFAVRDQLQTFARRCPATVLAQGSAKAPPAAPRDTIVLARADTTAKADRADTTGGMGKADTTAKADTTDKVGKTDSVAAALPPPARDPGVLVARLDTSKATPAPAPPSTRAHAPVYRVQIVAAPTAAAAEGPAQRARAAGLEVRTVNEGGLYKVRVGSYATRAEASAAARTLRADFPGAFLVTDQ